MRTAFQQSFAGINCMTASLLSRRARQPSSTRFPAGRDVRIGDHVDPGNLSVCDRDAQHQHEPPMGCDDTPTAPSTSAVRAA